jgi:SET domain-containing protein
MWKRSPTFCGNGLLRNVETLSYILWKRVSTICRNAEPHFVETLPKKNADRSASALIVSISTNLLPNLALHSPSQRESNRALVRASRIFF